MRGDEHIQAAMAQLACSSGLQCPPSVAPPPSTHQAVGTEHRPELIPLLLVLAGVVLHSGSLAVGTEVKAARALQVDWRAVLVHSVWVHPG
jgi:hypothetical protein